MKRKGREGMRRKGKEEGKGGGGGGRAWNNEQLVRKRTEKKGTRINTHAWMCFYVYDCIDQIVSTYINPPLNHELNNHHYHHHQSDRQS